MWEGLLREAQLLVDELTKLYPQDTLLSPLYTLAHLGLARAVALTGATTQSRKAYEDFFALWKEADADLPALREAKKGFN